jgi:hypothetical protein
VLGERGVDAGTCEYRARRATENQDIPMGSVVSFIKDQLRL